MISIDNIEFGTISTSIIINSFPFLVMGQYWYKFNNVTICLQALCIICC